MRLNPFGMPAQHQRAALVVPTLDLDDVAARLRRGGLAVQLLGEPGRGKTSHLHALHARFLDMPLVRLRAPCRELAAAPVMFVDEAQWLRRRAARRLFGACRAVVLAGHRDWGRTLRRAGMAVQTIRLDGLSLAQLGTYVHRRMTWAQRDPGPVPAPPRRVLAALHAQHRGDVRAIEAGLYDWIQSHV